MESIESCKGLHVSNKYSDCIKAAIPFLLQDLLVELRERLRAEWRELDGANPRTHTHKLAICHARMALHLKPSTARAVRREFNGADPRTHAHELASYHAQMASPLKPSTARDPPYLLCRYIGIYLQLEVSRHVLSNMAHFHLRTRFVFTCILFKSSVCQVGKSTIGSVTNVTCMISRMKNMFFFYALA